MPSAWSFKCRPIDYSSGVLGLSHQSSNTSVMVKRDCGKVNKVMFTNNKVNGKVRPQTVLTCIAHSSSLRGVTRPAPST